MRPPPAREEGFLGGRFAGAGRRSLEAAAVGKATQGKGKQREREREDGPDIIGLPKEAWGGPMWQSHSPLPSTPLFPNGPRPKPGYKSRALAIFWRKPHSPPPRFGFHRRGARRGRRWRATPPEPVAATGRASWSASSRTEPRRWRLSLTNPPPPPALPSLPLHPRTHFCLSDCSPS